jgi:hypothetical protein
VAQLRLFSKVRESSKFPVWRIAKCNDGPR